jgi:hypothetical protein
MASISITYTPNYLGCHRIYFKKAEDVDFCVYLDTSPSVVGVSKITEISLDEEPYSTCITPDDIQCTNLEVDGYVQACCSSENDEDSKVPFSFSIDVELCNAYLVSCPTSSISAIFMTNSGEGYTGTPTIVLTNTDGGIGFVGVVNMDGSVVDSVTVINNGQDYGPNTTINFVGGGPSVGATGTIEFCPCGNNCSIDAKVLPVDCIEGNTISLTPPSAGNSFIVCSLSLPTVNDAPRLSVTKSTTTTCCQCNTYLVSNADKSRPITVDYIGCDNIYRDVSIPALQGLSICAITNSIGVNPDYNYTVTLIGNCS